MEAPNRIFFQGAYKQEELVGFILSGVFSGVLNRFIRDNKWFLAGRVISHPWLVTSPVFRQAINLGVKKLRKRPSTVEKKANEANVPFVILSIAIHPEMQHLGIGQQLMAKAEYHAIAFGFTTMSLTVDPKNTTAIQFYKKLGWYIKNVNAYGDIEMYKSINENHRAEKHEISSD